MQCSYSAGALCAIYELYNLHHPDILVGSSGSAGSLSYYVGGQPDSIKNIWTNLLATSKFISKWRILKIMDLDYLINTVFKQQEPLDIEKIKQSNSRLFISATDEVNGKVRFFTNTDDIFLALKASKAIPLITATKVTIDNIEYIDGSISATFDVNTSKAISEGATDIILINDTGILSLGATLFWYFCSLFSSKNTKKLLTSYSKTSTISANSHKGVNIFVIEPSKKLKIHSLDNNRDHLKESFNLGFSDLQNSKDFEEFFQRYNSSLN